MRESKPRLTLTEAYIRHERNHPYKYGLHKTRTAGINGSRLSSRTDRSSVVVSKVQNEQGILLFVHGKLA